MKITNKNIIHQKFFILGNISESIKNLLLLDTKDFIEIKDIAVLSLSIIKIEQYQNN